MRVALYPRVSTQEQAKEGYSIGEQIDRLNKYCDAMGWTVVKTYTDAGFSGATMDRPALNQMIRDIKKGKIDKVVVYKLDRLSRSQKDTLYLIEDVFLANGTEFVSMSENFDTSTPFGRAIIGILAVFAQLEREQIKERMMMGKEARAKEGKFGGSWTVPIGYDYIPEKDALVVNDYERMQVLQLFDMFLGGMSIKKIEKELNDAGFTHKHGTWHNKTMRNVLRSKTYLGYIKYRGEWYKGSHDAIISESTHERAVKLLDKRKEAYEQNRREGKVQSYLGGLLHCKCCGGKYSKVISGQNKYMYYSCYSRHKRTPHLIKDPNCRNKNWRMEKLDELVFNEIRQLGTDPRYYDKIKEEKADDTRPQVIEAEIEKLDNQISKLMDFYMLGNMPLDMVEKKVHEINDHKEMLEHELEQIQAELKKALSREQVMEAVSSFGDVFETGDFQEIRTVLMSLIDYIIIDNDLVDIHWKFV